MTEKLKPCPFCGGLDIELKCIDREMFIYALVCNNDECGVQGTKFQICRCDRLFDILKKVRVEAERKWNNRAEITDTQHTQPKVDPACETCGRCDTTCMLELGSTACRTAYFGRA